MRRKLIPLPPTLPRPHLPCLFSFISPISLDKILSSLSLRLIILVNYRLIISKLFAFSLFLSLSLTLLKVHSSNTNKRDIFSRGNNITKPVIENKKKKKKIVT